METGDFFNKDIMMIEQMGVMNYASEIQYGAGLDDPSLLESELSREVWGQRSKKAGARSVLSKRYMQSMKAQSRSKYDRVIAGNLSEAKSFIYDLPQSRQAFQQQRDNFIEEMQVKQITSDQKSINRQTFEPLMQSHDRAGLQKLVSQQKDGRNMSNIINSKIPMTNSTAQLKKRPDNLVTDRTQNSPRGQLSLYESKDEVGDSIEQNVGNGSSFSYLPAIHGVARSNMQGSSSFLN